MAGPFDRYCGFCGHEMLAGASRSPLWRLWFLVALLPLGGSLLLGMSALNRPAAASAERLVAHLPLVQHRTNQSAMGFKYSYPPDWVAYDYSEAKAPQRAQPFVVVAHLQSDTAAAAAARGNLLAVTPTDGVAVLGRLPVAAPAVDPGDPVAVLSFQIGQLVSRPPAGTRIVIVMPVRPIQVDGRAGAEAVVQVQRGGNSYFLEQAYIADPGATSIAGPVALFTVEGAAPNGVWQQGTATTVEELIQSLKFGRR